MQNLDGGSVCYEFEHLVTFEPAGRENKKLRSLIQPEYVRSQHQRETTKCHPRMAPCRCVTITNLNPGTDGSNIWTGTTRGLFEYRFCEFLNALVTVASTKKNEEREKISSLKART